MSVSRFMGANSMSMAVMKETKPPTVVLSPDWDKATTTITARAMEARNCTMGPRAAAATVADIKPPLPFIGRQK